MIDTKTVLVGEANLPLFFASFFSREKKELESTEFLLALHEVSGDFRGNGPFWGSLTTFHGPQKS